MGAAGGPLSERIVLVVDDEEAVCHLATRILADAGFRALEAHSGGQALALLSALDGAAQLVVSDVTMPGMDGETLAKVIGLRWPTTPVLLMSGRGVPRAGYPGSFLPKPFMPDALLAAVTGLVPLPGS